MRHDGQRLKEMIDRYNIDISAFARKMGVSRQAAVNYYNSKKFNEKTLNKILNALNISKNKFFNKETTTNYLGVSEPAAPYGKNNELLEFCQKQLSIANKLLEKALENESKALDLLRNYQK